MATIRIGTTNAGKLREFRQMLEPMGFTVLGLEGVENFDVVEDGQTFAQNAIKKARTLMELTGEPAVADDSGLVVDALGGAPGIHSARYAAARAGEFEGDVDAANRAQLYEALNGVPDSERTARFVCELAFCAPGESPLTLRGVVEGTINRRERGSNGFGYDPMFVLDGDTRTTAELPPEEKNAISHRGKALRKLVSYLRDRGLVTRRT